MTPLTLQSANVYRLRAGVAQRVHRHSLAQLEVVLEGTHRLVSQDQEHILQPGSWVWLEPHVPHGWHNLTAVCCLTFKCRRPRQYVVSTQPVIVHMTSSDPWLAVLPQRVLELWTSDDPDLRQAAHWWLAAAIRLGLPAKPTNSEAGLDQPWRELLADLRRPATPYLALNAMAARVCMSSSGFRRRFRQQFGMPPAHYQLSAKMAWAQNILRHTSIPIKEVAYQLSYSDLAAFSRAFANHVGRRPRQLRG